VTNIKRQEANNQFDLFSGADVPETNTVIGLTLDIKEHEWDRKTLLSFEREMLGLYVSSHPLAGAERILRAQAERTVASVTDDELSDGTPVVLAGMLVGVQRRVTKKGKTWATATLEDLAGSIEVLFFPATYDGISDSLAEDIIVAIKGRVNQRDTGTVSIAAQDLAVLTVSDSDLDAHPPVLLTLPERLTAELVRDLRKILDAHPGSHPVHVRLGRVAVDRWLVEPTVSANGAFRSEIKGLLGAGACV
jgi:DNA polymerase-3 subunit alpha